MAADVAAGEASAVQQDGTQSWPQADDWAAEAAVAAQSQESMGAAGDEVSSWVPNPEPNPDFHPSAIGADKAAQESGQGASGTGSVGWEAGSGEVGSHQADSGGEAEWDGRRKSTPGLRFTNEDGQEIEDTTEGSEHGLYLYQAERVLVDQDGSGSEYETAEEGLDAVGQGGGWASTDDEPASTGASADQGLRDQGGFADSVSGDLAASFQEQPVPERDEGFGSDAANLVQPGEQTQTQLHETEPVSDPELPSQLSAAESLNTGLFASPDNDPFVHSRVPGEQSLHGHQVIGFASDPFAEASDPFAEIQGTGGFVSDPFAETQGVDGFQADPFAEIQSVGGFESDPFAEIRGGGGFVSDPFAENQVGVVEGGGGFESGVVGETLRGGGLGNLATDPFEETVMEGGAGWAAEPYGSATLAETVGAITDRGSQQEVIDSSGFSSFGGQGGFGTFPGAGGIKETAKEVTAPRAHKEPENSDLSEDEVANRRYGNLYQEIDAEKEEATNNAFNGFSQDTSAPAFFADFDKMKETLLAEDVGEMSPSEAAPLVCVPSREEDKDIPGEEAPTIVAEAVDEKPEESATQGSAVTGLEEEKMPIPCVVIEPASSNEGDDDRDGDIISPTTVSDNGVTPDHQTAKEISSSGELPHDFMYRVETLHDFEAANSDELELKKGDVVLVIPTALTEDQDAGWLTGIKESEWSQLGAGAQKGLFPENFTQRLE